MYGSRKKEDQEPKHEHAWEKSDWSQSNCSCGAILVSEPEYQKRQADWDKYDQDVKGTQAYQIFALTRQAFRMGDKTRVKELALQARQLLEERGFKKIDGRWVLPAGIKEVGEIAKPRFPRPSFAKYVISGEENDES